MAVFWHNYFPSRVLPTWSYNSKASHLNNRWFQYCSEVLMKSINPSVLTPSEAQPTRYYPTIQILHCVYKFEHTGGCTNMGDGSMKYGSMRDSMQSDRCCGQWWSNPLCSHPLQRSAGRLCCRLDTVHSPRQMPDGERAEAPCECCSMRQSETHKQVFLQDKTMKTWDWNGLRLDVTSYYLAELGDTITCFLTRR